VRMAATNLGDEPCPFGGGATHLTAGESPIDGCSVRVPAAARRRRRRGIRPGGSRWRERPRTFASAGDRRSPAGHGVHRARRDGGRVARVELICSHRRPARGWRPRRSLPDGVQRRHPRPDRRRRASRWSR
jgi:hypothetical protein